MATKEMETPTTGAPIGEHHDRDVWLEWRRGHVGASEAAALFDMHPFMTKRELYFKKIGPYETKETNAMRRGSALEHVAVEEFERITGRKTRRIPARRHPELEYLGSSLDRQILAGPDQAGEEHPTSGLEVKVPGFHTFDKIKEEGLPDYMVFQAQVEAVVYGYDRITFAVLHADSFELLTFDVRCDPSIEAAILGEVERFWTEHVVPRIPPDAEDRGEPIETPESKGEIVYVDDVHIQDLMERVEKAKKVRDEASDIYSALKDELQEALGEEAGKHRAANGTIEVNLYWRKGRTSFNDKELQAVQPLDPERFREFLVNDVGGFTDEEIESLRLALRLDLTEFERYGRPGLSMRLSRYTPDEF